MSLKPQPFRKQGVPQECFTLSLLAPKVKRAAAGLLIHRLPAKATSRAEPPRDTTQADSPAREGIPLFFPRHQCSGSCICTWPTRWHWQKNFAPSFFFSPCLCHQAHHWPWTDSEKDCHLLKHHIIFPHSWFSLLTCPQVTQPAGSCWFHPRGGVWGTQLKAAYFQ